MSLLHAEKTKLTQEPNQIWRDRTTASPSTQSTKLDAESGNGPTFKDQFHDGIGPVTSSAHATDHRVVTAVPKFPQEAIPNTVATAAPPLVHNVHAIPISPTQIRNEKLIGDLRDRLRLCRCFGFGFILVLFVVGVSLSIICGVGGVCSPKRESSLENGDNASREPTGISRNSPTSSPTLSERAEIIIAIVIAKSLSQTSIEYPPSAAKTADERALQWLVEDDFFPMDLQNESRVIQRFVLATLFFHLGPGELGSDLLGDKAWLRSSDECSWARVSCGSDDRHLDVLDLAVTNLQGTIPNNIGLLSTLKILDLGGNFIRGSLPTTLTQLTRLNFLYLGANELEGSLPEFLADLTNLSRLVLEDNKFEGRLFHWLHRLTNLNHLDITDNRFVDSLPPTLGLLTNMVIFAAGQNSIEGTIPSEMKSMTLLQALYIFDTRITGTIPNWLSELTDLYLIGLDDNDLIGKIPSSFSSLTNLESLNVALNGLTGTLPSELASLTALTLVNLRQNNLIGTLPPELGSLSNLNLFGVRNNDLTGTIPTEYANWTRLEAGTFQNTLLNGSMPFCSGTFVELDSLGADCDELQCSCCSVCCPSLQQVGNEDTCVQ